MKFKVRPYYTRDGAQPAMSFLAELKQKQPDLGKLLEAGIRKLEDSDYHGEPLTELVDSETRILELRVGKKNIARAFFFFRKGQEIIVTNGYVKHGQKLDRGELKKAQEYKADWEERFP